MLNPLQKGPQRSTQGLHKALQKDPHEAVIRFDDAVNSIGIAFMRDVVEAVYKESMPLPVSMSILRSWYLARLPLSALLLLPARSPLGTKFKI